MNHSIRFFSITHSILFFFSLLFFFFPDRLFAIGASPGVIVSGKLERLEIVEHTTKLLRSPNETGELYFSLSVRGEAAEYITVPETVRFSESEESVPLSFSIETGNIPSGKHRAMIDVVQKKSTQTKSNDLSLRVANGISIPVQFSVSGDDIVSYTIEDLQVPAEQGEISPYFDLVVTNIGTTDWKPESITLILKNVQTQEIQEKTLYAKNGEYIAAPPDTTTEIPLQPWPIISPGQYTIEAIIREDDKNIKTFEPRPFEIVASALQQEEKESRALSPTLMKWILPALIGILLFVLSFFLLKKRGVFQKKHKRKIPKKMIPKKSNDLFSEDSQDLQDVEAEKRKKKK